MATMELNDALAIGSAVREAMIEDVLPIVQERPAAIIGDRDPVGLGWLRDLPDFRDYTAESAAIAPHLKAIGISEPQDLAVPAKVDLRAYCSPVEDQGALGSCTANAVGSVSKVVILYGQYSSGGTPKSASAPIVERR